MRSSTITTMMRRRARQAVGLAVVAGAAFALTAPSASALEFEQLSAEVNDLAGNATRQAGSHPDSAVSFWARPVNAEDPQSFPEQQPHRFQIDVPPGLIGNPLAAERCEDSELKAGASGNWAVCPVASQVGIARVYSKNGSWEPGSETPVYNVEPPDDKPAMFAFNYIGSVVKITPSIRPGDHGVTVDSGVISQAIPIYGARVTLWGVPADPAHDPDRFEPKFGGFLFARPAVSHSERKPFLSLPTSCPGRVETLTARLDGWDSIGQFTSRSFTTDPNDVPFINTGCERLPFAPSALVEAPSRSVESPTGLDAELKVPQADSPDGLSTAHVRDVTVTLPDGMVVSPSSAPGLEACAPAQIGIGVDAEPTCPRASKLGTVVAETPLLEEPLNGEIFLAQQNENPFESMLAMYLVVRGPGVLVKIPGRVDADPVSGRLTATFKNNPQFPVSVLRVKLPGGENAPLATPASCGIYQTATNIVSWATPEVHALGTPMAIDQGCDRGGFRPEVSAGSTNTAAGEHATFALRIQRADGQQHVRSVTTTMPTGLLANIASVPLCGEAQANAGTCDEASQVGTTRTAAGPGTSPLTLPGKVFLTGGYKGGQYGLAIVVRAVAGPFDLGTVVVRASITVDPIDAHVTVVSDDVPNILSVKGKDGVSNGFKLLLRDIQVNVDRPSFIINPTSCAPKSIGGSIGSYGGATVAIVERFQVDNCAGLDLKPNLALSLSGKGQTTDGKHPAISAVLTQKPGQSNLSKVRVALPLSLALDPDNANGLCEFVDGSKVEPTCPKASIVGKATATTPILNEPLSGPVYFVKNIRKDPKSGREIRTLPKLVLPLTGPNGIKLTLTGTSAVENDRLVTTFENIPDAPVSSFKMDIIGGKGGILTVSNADICKSTQVAGQQVDGQNGKDADASVSIQTPSCALKVVSKKVGKTSVAVKVSGLGAGKVTITGKGIKKTTKTITKATVATITAKRTKGKPSKVTVTYDPTGPAKPRKTTK
jgi:hypothetical protein